MPDPGALHRGAARRPRLRRRRAAAGAHRLHGLLRSARPVLHLPSGGSRREPLRRAPAGTALRPARALTRGPAGGAGINIPTIGLLAAGRCERVRLTSKQGTRDGPPWDLRPRTNVLM
ncbi:hypothetical protein FRAHR75_190043 [Frankia sp. Hr75.2]|nr:hypothetical protein FRAHR75_190043 [Frankia sp. Hr75.2]